LNTYAQTVDCIIDHSLDGIDVCRWL